MAQEWIAHTQKIKTFYNWSFHDLAKELNLSQLEIDILLFLHNNPKNNVARDLCNLRGIAKSNASNGIRLLEKKGFLVSSADADSRKIRRLNLTSAGQGIAKRLAAKQRDIFETMFAGVSKEQIQIVQQIMDQCEKNMEEQMKWNFL